MFFHFGLSFATMYCAFIIKSVVSAIMIKLLLLMRDGLFKIDGFHFIVSDTQALAFANLSLIFSFCASHSVVCIYSSSSASAASSATLILSSNSFSLDDFDPLEDLDSFDVFDPCDVFDAELLLLLDEPFDSFSSSAFFNQYVIFLLKENTWLSISSNYSSSLTLASSSKSSLYSS